MKITIAVAGCEPLTFDGRYCPELETKNWHYYEIYEDCSVGSEGDMVHYRKDGKGYIIGGTYSDIIQAKEIKAGTAQYC